MKRFAVRLTLTVHVDVPEGHPLTAAGLRSTIEWKSNDYTDGRHPFSTEMAMVGAERAVRWGVEEALFQKYADWPMFKGPEGWARLDKRNALVARRSAEAFVSVEPTPFVVEVVEESEEAE